MEQRSGVRFLVIDAGAITYIDYSAARTVRDLCTALRGRGVDVVFAHVRPGLRSDMTRHGIVHVIGENAMFDTLHESLAAIRAAGHDLDAAPSQ